MFVPIVMALVLAAAPQGRKLPAPAPSAPLQFCNFARVIGPGPASVVADPGKPAKPFARLAEGSVIYACDARGDWLKVYYGAPGTCGAASAGGLDGRKTLSCRAGWVRKGLVALLPD